VCLFAIITPTPPIIAFGIVWIFFFQNTKIWAWKFPTLRNAGTKIIILSTRHLFRVKFAVVCRKIATFYPLLTFFKKKRRLCFSLLRLFLIVLLFFFLLPLYTNKDFSILIPIYAMHYILFAQVVSTSADTSSVRLQRLPASIASQQIEDVQIRFSWHHFDCFKYSCCSL